MQIFDQRLISLERKNTDLDVLLNDVKDRGLRASQ